jgi:RNA polymerase sigma-70 factor (ECF subfamily)
MSTWQNRSDSFIVGSGYSLTDILVAALQCYGSACFSLTLWHFWRNFLVYLINTDSFLDEQHSKLIRRAIDGDEAAYTHLLDSYRSAIYNLLYKMVHNHEETEDLVQEAFMKAFKALPSFNEEYAFSTWLYKIAINNCIDHMRKKRLKTYSMDKPVQSKDGEVSRDFPDTSMSPDKHILHKERAQLINVAIEDLPENYKVAILLRHTEEKSYEEIAEILDIPLGTVKARIFRAREMLKKKLKNKIMR